MFEGVREFATKVKETVKKMIKFFTSFIGQIVFFVLAVGFLALLVYVIANVIAKDLAKLLGVEGGAQSDKYDYGFANDLNESGYTEMLSAKQLVEYYAFEYAVLMDAAEFLEETGTLRLNLGDTSEIDFDTMSLEQWAFLAAGGSQEDYLAKYGGGPGTKPSTADASLIDNEEGMFDRARVAADTMGYDESEFTTELSSKHLYYKAVYNEYTEEISLVPYLRIPRSAMRYTYYFKIRGVNAFEDMMNPEIVDQSYIFERGSRFTGEVPVSERKSLEERMNWLMENVSPHTFSRVLNARNVAAHKPGQNMEDSMPSGNVDLYDFYPKTLFYDKKDMGSRTYHVPLRVLLDRFLPNAILMTSWRLLDENGNTNDAVYLVNQIQQIYSEACGGPEEVGETFAFFEAGELQINLFGAWEVAGYTNKSRTEKWEGEEFWVVEDAFEGFSLGDGGEIDNLEMDFKFEWREPETTYYSASAPGPNGEIKGSSTVYREESASAKLGPGDIVPRLNVDLVDLVCALLNAQVKGDGDLPDGMIADAQYKQLAHDNLAIVRDADTPGLRDFSDEALAYPENANAAAGSGLVTHCTGTDEAGETDITERDYVSLKMLQGKDQAIYTGSEPLQLHTDLLTTFLLQNVTEELLSDLRSECGADSDSKVTITVHADELQPTYSAVFPVDIKWAPIKQTIQQKRMPIYLVKHAVMWSSIKDFENTFTLKGSWNNQENPRYLITANTMSMGLYDWDTTKNIQWRGQLFAPIFGGVADTSTRESDVFLIMSEWEEAADNGIHAADHFIRDLYALLQYSKGIREEDANGNPIQGQFLTEPITGPNGPYIHENSYTYLYIPEDILTFDDSVCEQAFWLDRLHATTGEDAIDEQHENYIRSRREYYEWQIVDYQLYPECGGNVYLLWPYGGQLSRALYSFAANASAEENDKISGWGGQSGFHNALDLYGRRSSTKIYNAGISMSAHYEGGEAFLDTYEGNGQGLYFKDVFHTLILGNREYYINGTASAVFGYELYRRTLLYKDGEKAYEDLYNQLYDEKVWQEIRAMSPGVVYKVGANAVSGFKVNIVASSGSGTRYWICHMKRFPVAQEGDAVEAGQVLGFEGTTGRSGGYHAHVGTSNASEVQLIDYFYPFFTPFFYEEKAAEDDYRLDSEYMTLERTVFPYGQVTSISTGLETDGDILKISNYVPNLAFCSVEELYRGDHAKDCPDYVDFSKLPTEGVDYSLGGSDSGMIITTNPKYFDEGYIREVAVNAKQIDALRGGNQIVGGFTSNGLWEYNWDVGSKPDFDPEAMPAGMWEKYEKELDRQIRKGGGPGSRGAVVAAARFLCGFPYKIEYTSLPQSVEGDIGYYNHKGLNPTWGTEVTGHSQNGLDCVGFLCWTLVNAGIRAEGSGATSNTWPGIANATQIGNCDVIKPGDTIHTKDGDEWTHVGIVIGVDDENVYVAEAQTTDYTGTTVNALVMTTYPRSYVGKFGYITNCDSRYSKEGKYSMELPKYAK